MLRRSSAPFTANQGALHSLTMAAGPQVVNIATVDPKQLVEVQERVQVGVARPALRLGCC